ncbi:hypothetical protein CBS11852_1443 [Aspergillus niger]|nr:hypothetical protein CBS11852_1443 [Aspergillus niger]
MQPNSLLLDTSFTVMAPQTVQILSLFRPDKVNAGTSSPSIRFYKDFCSTQPPVLSRPVRSELQTLL